MSMNMYRYNIWNVIMNMYMYVIVTSCCWCGHSGHAHQRHDDTVLIFHVAGL